MNSPTSDEDDTVWYTFFSEREKREYYYDPLSRKATWILPDGARRRVAEGTDESFPLVVEEEEDEDDEHRESWILRLIFLLAKLPLLLFIFIVIFSYLGPHRSEVNLQNSTTVAVEPAIVTTKAFDHGSVVDLLNLQRPPAEHKKKEEVPPVKPTVQKEIKKEIKKETPQEKPKDPKKQMKKEKKDPPKRQQKIVEESTTNGTSVLALEQLTERIESALKSGENLMKRILSDAWAAGMAIEPEEPVEEDPPCKAPFSHIFKAECRNKKKAAFNAEKFAESMLD